MQKRIALRKNFEELRTFFRHLSTQSEEMAEEGTITRARYFETQGIDFLLFDQFTQRFVEVD